jgi:hypothetical protein
MTDIYAIFTGCYNTRFGAGLRLFLVLLVLVSDEPVEQPHAPA